MKREIKLNFGHLFELPTLEITGAQPNCFRAGLVFVELELFNKHFFGIFSISNFPLEKSLEFSLPDTQILEFIQ